MRTPISLATLDDPETVAAAPEDVQRLVADLGLPALAVRRLLGRLEVVWANEAAAELVDVEPGCHLDPEHLDEAHLITVDRPHWVQVLWQLTNGDGHGTEWYGAAGVSPEPGRAVLQIRAAQSGSGLWAVWLRPASEPAVLAEQARREAQHRFDALAEAAPIGIVVSEAGTRLGFVNHCFAEIVGVERSALLGTRWLKPVLPEDLPALVETLERVLSGSPAETTLRIHSARNGIRRVQIRLSPVLTPRRAAGFIGSIEDVTARYAWESQLTYQATHDSLTGLVNRRHLMDMLGELQASRRSRDGDAAVMFCDLDGFKLVNDTYGHDAGDSVLVEVARRLVATARDHDVVARIAGDEFVVLLKNISGYADAERAAARQIEALAAPVVLGERRISLSVSVGIAMARDFGEAQSILQAADRVMYEAKRSGPGRFRRARPGRDGAEQDGVEQDGVEQDGVEQDGGAAA